MQGIIKDGWVGGSKFSFSSVDEQQNSDFTIQILANQGHFILRLTPIITDIFGLAPSAPPPTGQRTIAKSPTKNLGFPQPIY